MIATTILFLSLLLPFAQQQEEQKPGVPLKDKGISSAGWKVIAAGLAVLVAGFIVLTRTDPAGQNWASVLSPFLIVGGYVIIGVGIVFPEKGEETPQEQQTQEQ